MSKEFGKWVAMWGNAVSIAENRPESYAKDITLRYPIYCPFDGDSIRLTFDNYCGTQKISIERVTVLLNDVFYDEQKKNLVKFFYDFLENDAVKQIKGKEEPNFVPNAFSFKDK